MSVLAWAGLCSSSTGLVVVFCYTAINRRLRDRGPKATWIGGWLVAAGGMTLMFTGWGLLAISGPHFESLPLRIAGTASGAGAVALYLASARWVGRLRSLKTYSLELRVEGIYRLTRHPQALALCLVSVAVGLVSLSRDYLLTSPLWIAGWVVYTYIEERVELIPAFGDAYRRYRSNTPRILPTLRSFRAWLKQTG